MTSSKKENWQLYPADRVGPISENRDNHFMESDAALMPPPCFTPHGSAIDLNLARPSTGQETPATSEKDDTENQFWAVLFKNFLCQEVQPILVEASERLDVATVEMNQCLLK